MYVVTFSNDTTCVATRVFCLHHAHDPEGEKTSVWAQISGAKRRLDPKAIKDITRDWA